MFHSRRIRFQCLITLASFLLFVSVGFMTPHSSFAKSATRLQPGTTAARSWSIVASPNQVSNNDYLSSVATVSASDVWAVGSYFNSSGTPQTLIEHWDGTNWSIVASPNQGTNYNQLYGVTEVSANDIWAVGYFLGSRAYQTLIEHWNGTSWSIVPSPNHGSYNNSLSAVAAFSANNIWAVGYYSTSSSPQTLIEHWNGTSWKIVASPNLGAYNNVLDGIVVGPANNIWAVGYADTQTLIEQWNGTSWNIVASPNPGPNVNRLYGVTASSASDIWAVGFYSTSSGAYQSLIEHWDGTSWSVVASPNHSSTDVELYSVAGVSASNIWTVGSYSNSKGILQTLIEHWNGTSWSIVASPVQGTGYNALYGVAAVPGSINMWAVGDYSPTNSGQTSTLTEYYG